VRFIPPLAWNLFRTVSLGTVSLGTVSLGTVSLGTVSLGTVSLGTVREALAGLRFLNDPLRLGPVHPPANVGGLAWL
jgi:hypothetical protein